MLAMADVAEMEGMEEPGRPRVTAVRHLVELMEAHVIPRNRMMGLILASTPVPGETAAPEAPVVQEVEEPVGLRGAFTAWIPHRPSMTQRPSMQEQRALAVRATEMLERMESRHL